MYRDQRIRVTERADGSAQVSYWADYQGHPLDVVKLPATDRDHAAVKALGVLTVLAQEGYVIHGLERLAHKLDFWVEQSLSDSVVLFFDVE